MSKGEQEARCPVCATPTGAKRADTPYWVCTACALWFQHPQPPKTFEGAHEAPGDQMSHGDKAANEQLAAWLFEHVLHGKPEATLDVGAKYPYLASRLKSRGCDAVAIDGDPKILAYGEQLGVSVRVKSFEDFVESPHSSDLVTLVHCFEHLYDPLAALRKLRRMVVDDGRVFIRLPDHDVRGIERDLTPGHYTIHPFVWNLTALREALVQVRDCFVIDETYALAPGQRDLVLRPIARAPTVALGMIAKNEARDIPKALRSVAETVDSVVLVDTGSTDGTIDVAADACTVPFDARVYTGASERNGAGDWLLLDFAKARNQYVERIENLGHDWLFWLDADDELLTPRELRRASYDYSADVWDCWIQSGGDTWVTCRMWQTGKGIRFKGRCHEFPVLGEAKRGMLPGLLIRHDATPTGAGEDSNARNLRMLTLEWQDEPSPRTAFYVANTHKDAGRWQEAITWYNRRIEFGEGFRDEWLFAWLYRARSERALELFDAADCTCIIALEQAHDWMEFVMERAQIAYQRGHHRRCIEIASQAVGRPIPATLLWREVDKYTDRPLRLISWCYEHLGKIGEALEFGEKAKLAIRAPDPEWDARIARLKQSSGPFVASRKQAAIALWRPGAIGDVLMTLNLIPALREANPGVPIHYFTSSRIGADGALRGVMAAAGVDLIMDAAHWGEWRGKYERAIELVGYPLAEGYPGEPMRLHLLEYFAHEMGLASLKLAYGADERKPVLMRTAEPYLPALTLRRPKRPKWCPEGDYITLQWKAGWSKYKQWPQERWQEVLCNAGLYRETVLIDERDKRPLAESIAAVANARMHIGIDSFCNHLTNYFWTDGRGNGRRVPGVILWGSTQASAAGYPHNTNISLGLPCQPCFRENPDISTMPRGPCVNPARESYASDKPWACMAGISVERVVEAVREMWERTATKVAA